MTKRQQIEAMLADGERSTRIIAAEVGCSQRYVQRVIEASDYEPGEPTPHAEVRNAELLPIVERAMLENDVSWSELAKRCGLTRWASGGSRRRVGDATQIRRRLGQVASSKDGKHYYQRALGYDLAVKIAVSAGLDPVDVGL